MSAKPERDLTQRVMRTLYYDLLAISEEIDRADPSERETLRALLAILHQISNPYTISVYAARSQQTISRWLTDSESLPTMGVVVARQVAKMKELLEAVIQELPRPATAIAPSQYHKLRAPSKCQTKNLAPSTISPATTKSAPTTSSYSGASATSAAGKTGSKSTAETPKSARHPTGASGRLKS